MRILIIGDPTGRDDEGMKRVNKHLQNEFVALGHKCVVDTGLTYASNRHSWDKIVCTGGPSQKTLYKIAALRVLHRKSEIILCGLMPQISPKRSIILRKCVDRVISTNSQILEFARINHIPTAVQTAATFSFKRFLRDRERTKPQMVDRPLKVLHVGHLNEKRNVYELALLCKKSGFQITFLVSSTEKEEIAERMRLEELGAEIISEYQEDLFEFYRQYDVYAFPVRRSDAAISMPLSIIEALLAGLNVFSTNFGDVSENFGHSECVKISDTLSAMTAEEIEELAQRPMMNLKELQKYDTKRFAEEITGQNDHYN